MNQKKLIDSTVAFVKKSFEGAEGGHDWWHTYRVWKSAKHIAKVEDVDMLTVEIGSLLHDIADSKFYQGDEEIGPRKAKEFLSEFNLDETFVRHVVNIVANISFRGGNHLQKFRSLELDVVQDADRLDSLGAIAIARTFSYGGFMKREIYNPEIKPNLKMTKEEYKKSNSPSLNHFYEKLLLLKDRMNTKTGSAMAEKRHDFLELYLEHFFQEWEGDR